jgi:hypothetical protein
VDRFYYYVLLFAAITLIFINEGHLPNGGSYVTLVPPSKNGDFSLIIETMTHDHSVCIRPSLPAYNVTAQTVF